MGRFMFDWFFISLSLIIGYYLAAICVSEPLGSTKGKTSWVRCYSGGHVIFDRAIDDQVQFRSESILINGNPRTVIYGTCIVETEQ